MSPEHQNTVGRGNEGLGNDGWWRCRGCGRPSGIGTTCLACTLGVGRGEPDAPTERLDLARLRAGLPTTAPGRPQPQAQSMPSPVQLAEFLVRAGAVVVSLSLLLTLAVGAAAVSIAVASPGDEAVGELVKLFIGQAAYTAAHIVIAIYGTKGLRRGNPSARLLVTALPLLDLAELGWEGGAASSIALAVHVGVAALLWLPESAQELFAAPSRSPHPRPPLAPAS